ncbi:MAG: hypothetical protein ACYCPT_04490 [Acidimicrobiales bacterium]
MTSSLRNVEPRWAFSRLGQVATMKELVTSHLRLAALALEFVPTALYAVAQLVMARDEGLSLWHFRNMLMVERETRRRYWHRQKCWRGAPRHDAQRHYGYFEK